jgi:hypothetical protein
MRKGLVVLLLLLLACPGCWGCSEEAEEAPAQEIVAPPPPAPPRVLGLSADEVRVGDRLDFYVSGALDKQAGRCLLVFRGQFIGTDGNVAAKEIELKVLPKPTGTVEEELARPDKSVIPAQTPVLTWARFGPFVEPFSGKGNLVGAFKGTVTAQNEYRDETVVEDPAPPEIELEVLPSIVIRKLEPFLGLDEQQLPILAGCSQPAIRALPNIPYVLEVEATGFEPVSFHYDLWGLNSSYAGPLIVVDHEAAGKTDTLGFPVGELARTLVFHSVPEGYSFHLSGIRIVATEASGATLETVLVVPVHRPVEFLLDMSGYRLAEVFEPTKAGDCIPGTDTEFGYAENSIEWRQKALTVHFNSAWLDRNLPEDFVAWEYTPFALGPSWPGEDSLYPAPEDAAASYGLDYPEGEPRPIVFDTVDGEVWGWQTLPGSDNNTFRNTMWGLFPGGLDGITVEVSGSLSVARAIDSAGKMAVATGLLELFFDDVEQYQAAGNGTGYYMKTGPFVTSDFPLPANDSKGKTIRGTYRLVAEADVGALSFWDFVAEGSIMYRFTGEADDSGLVAYEESDAWNESWVKSKDSQALAQARGTIPSGSFGAWYRQTKRYVRWGDLLTYDLCGRRQTLGRAALHTWRFEGGLATAKDCAHLDPSSTGLAKPKVVFQ